MNILLRIFFIISIMCACAGAGLLFFVVHNNVIDFSVLEQYHTVTQPSVLLDDEGNEWARFQLDRRDPIKLEVMPPHLIHAFLAAEDWRFFEHAGISWKGILRSAVVNISRGRKAQGASTITQQLVRLLFLDTKKTFTRKIKEQLVALLVEWHFSKEQILETYLNHVCFGCGIYGVEAACQRFWGKPAAHVTIDEAAVLAGIMRAPNRYCPILNPLAAEKRRNVILHSMAKLQFISQEEYEQAKAIKVSVKNADHAHSAPHLKEMLRIFLEDTVGKTTLYTGGLTVQTTLNSTAQAIAHQEFTKQFKELRAGLLPGVDGGLVTLDVKTGEIKALIGGFDFVTSKFNRATQARRQMGSTFKPLVYAAAVAQGKKMSALELDEPLELKTATGVWRPNNVYDQFDGKMTLAWALSSSNNIVAIKTLLNVGAENIIALAEQAGIKGPCKPYPSLALGCVDATVQEVAGMFNIFANDGVFVSPHAVVWIKDRWGNKIWRYAESSKRVLSSRVSGQIAKVLELGLKRIHTMVNEPWIGSEAISKTGTTNDFRTCWFAGSTPELTTVVYVGRDDNKPIGRNLFPLKTVFPIWLSLHRQLPVAQQQFVYDPSLQELVVNKWTGRQISLTDTDAINVMM